MIPNLRQDLLRRIPSIGELFAAPVAAGWLEVHPRSLVGDCLRDAVSELRRQVLADAAGRCGPQHVCAEYVLRQAGRLLAERAAPRLRGAVNATGVLMHTGLGRSVLPAGVVDSICEELKGYITLAVDRETGQRSERDERVEPILAELTGAEAATVVTNNAAATLIVLAALAAGREVIVSRGQLIEIGGSFRLPDVMEQSGCRLVEVGTTNRTHLRDYRRAVTDQTAAVMRVHPSNFRVLGFTAEVPLGELVELAHEHGRWMIDDLGAGALVDLAAYGLPHEPTVQESIAAGADVVLCSGDKLIGAAQAGVIVGRRECIERIRRHPLARAVRPDKFCVMALERTLMLFRDPARLRAQHPLYRALATPPEAVRDRAQRLLEAIRAACPGAQAEVCQTVGFLGSGSVPMEALPTHAVTLALDGVRAGELARRLRLDEACVFARLESERVLLDARTLTDEQVPLVAEAVGRAAGAE